MLDLSEPQGRVALLVILAAVLIAGYFLWTRTAPPVPRPGPGQTLENPFGTAAPRPGGAPAAPNVTGPSPGAPFARGR
jgi:hypothetical protein